MKMSKMDREIAKMSKEEMKKGMDFSFEEALGLVTQYIVVGLVVFFSIYGLIHWIS